MTKIIEATTLPKEERVYLRKSFGEWRVVHPLKNEDGTLNFKNLFFGGWGNLFSVLFIVILTLGFVYIYYHDTQEMQKVVENPCGYCSTTMMQETLQGRLDNFSKVNDKIKDKYDVNWSGVIG